MPIVPLNLHSIIPFFALINFILIIVFLILNRRFLLSYASKIKRTTWIVLFLIFLFALCLRIFIPLNHHRMWTDEALYMDAAKNMLQTGSQADYPKAIGWPFLLIFPFAIFGISNWVAIYFSLFLGAFTVVTFFLLGYALTKDETIGIFSSLLLSVLPISLIWSGTAMSNAPSLFFVSLTLFIAVLYFQNPRMPLMLLLFSLLAYTAQLRLEDNLLILLVVGWKITYDRGIRNILKTRFIIPLALIFLLTLPNLIEVAGFYVPQCWMQSDTEGHQQGDNWSLYNLYHNTISYGGEVFTLYRMPIILFMLTLIGIAFMLMNKKYLTLLMLSEGIIFFWILMFSSWLQTTGARPRLYLPLYIFITILASYAISRISGWISRNMRPISKTAICLIFTIIIAVSFIPSFGFIKEEKDNNRQYLETIIPELAEKDLPKDCVIFANEPVILRSTTNLDVIDVARFLDDKKFQDDILFNSSCVLFFRDYCCLDWTMYNHGKNCQGIEDGFNLENFKSYSAGEKTYSFMKILSRK